MKLSSNTVGTCGLDYWTGNRDAGSWSLMNSGWGLQMMPQPIIRIQKQIQITVWWWDEQACLMMFAYDVTPNNEQTPTRNVSWIWAHLWGRAIFVWQKVNKSSWFDVYKQACKPLSYASQKFCPLTGVKCRATGVANEKETICVPHIISPKLWLHISICQTYFLCGGFA